MSKFLILPAETGKPEPEIHDSIVMQTRNKTDIQNKQIKNITRSKLFNHQIENLKREHIGVIERPNTISGIYNCHGMTFANRRTGIDLTSEITKIIEEDCYTEIECEKIIAGDVVLYIADDGDISHSGILMDVPRGFGKEQFSSLTVMSKWGDGFEAIHGIYNCPYPVNNIKFFRCTAN